MLALWFLAWVIKPKDKQTVMHHTVYVERPMPLREVSSAASGRHYDADGRVAPIRGERREPYFGRQRR
jgi:hypothetical protein